MNWAAEWRDPRRDAVDGIVVNAQSLVRHGLCPPAEPRASATRKARTAASRR